MATQPRAIVRFAPGEKTKYIIWDTLKNAPYPGDSNTVYDDPFVAQHRAEWLNWNSASKGSNRYHHPREEQAAERARAREALLAAHAALSERERLGPAIAHQLSEARKALVREEQAQAHYAMQAGQDHRTAKDRKELRELAASCERRAAGLREKIARLQASPPLPSRLAVPPASAVKDTPTVSPPASPAAAVTTSAPEPPPGPGVPAAKRKRGRPPLRKEQPPVE